MKYRLRPAKEREKSEARRGMFAMRRYQKDVSESDAALESALEKVRQLKLRAPRRPGGKDGELSPELPRDITRITDDDLGRIHGEFAALAQYVGYYAALRAVEHSVAKRVDRLTRARVRMEKSGTVDDKAAKVEADPRTEKASLRLLVAENAENLTQALLQGFVIGRETTSREMTRRMSLNGGNRG